MAGNTRIIALDMAQESPEEDILTLTAELAEPEPLDLKAFTEVDETPPPPPERMPWLAPILALTTVAAWSGFFIWAHRADEGIAIYPNTWPALAADWATPVLLICVVWLLAMRNSRHEARRFGKTARTLSDESTRLEARLVTVNRELSLAREFITAQSQDLDALGRIAVEKLTQHADRLQMLIRDNGLRVNSIAGVSEAALDNMEKLRGQLPVLASSAKDVANNIGNAGRTAQTQIDSLTEGFKQLQDSGEASELRVQAMRGKVEEALAELSRQSDALEESLASRFAALSAKGEEFRAQLNTHESEAVASLRSRAASLAEELEQTRQLLDSHEEQSLTSLRARLSALRDESGTISRTLSENETRALASWREAIGRLEEEITQKITLLEKTEADAVQAARARFETLSAETAAIEAGIAETSRTFAQEMDQRRDAALVHAEDAATRLAAQLATLDTNLAERRAAHEQQTAALIAQGEAISARLTEFEQQSLQIATLGRDAENNLSSSLQTLAAKLAESREALAGTDHAIASLTDSSVRLLELIRASTQHSNQELAETLGANEQRLAGIETSVSTMQQAIAAANGMGQDLSGQLSASANALQSAFREIEQAYGALDKHGTAHTETLAQLRQSLEELEQQSQAYSDKAKDELAKAIDVLAQSGREAIEGFSQLGEQAISGLAGRLAEESAGALDKALRETISETAGQVETAATQAAGVSREAATQMRNQLVKVSELVGNLEKRVTYARERAEEQVNSDFARRAALITESLNSNAIDIAKALSNEVTETAWTAYLRGERGVFTRRAVSLLENAEAKAVSHIYESDRDFREHVSRYIHDFEAMLRQVLSTRDGHALGVTLLSSDMGKLYVALAQSIERLRS